MKWKHKAEALFSKRQLQPNSLSASTATSIIVHEPDPQKSLFGITLGGKSGYVFLYSFMSLGYILITSCAAVTSEATLKQTNHKTNVHRHCSTKKVVCTLIPSVWCPSPGALPTNYPDPDPDTAAFSRKMTTRCTTKLKKNPLHYYTHYKMHHCPTKHSKVDDIRIQRHNTHAVTDKTHLVQTTMTANVAHVITSAQHARQAVKVIAWSYVTSHNCHLPHPIPA